jgi:hypothetical protein
MAADAENREPNADRWDAIIANLTAVADYLENRQAGALGPKPILYWPDLEPGQTLTLIAGQGRGSKKPPAKLASVGSNP